MTKHFFSVLLGTILLGCLQTGCANAPIAAATGIDPIIFVAAGPMYSPPAFGDFNGDGYSDIAVGNVIYLQQPNNTILSKLTITDECLWRR